MSYKHWPAFVKPTIDPLHKKPLFHWAMTMHSGRNGKAI